MSSTTTTQKIQVSEGSKVFYREAGASNSQKLLLLHGFPTSSHMFRTFIPILGSRYHVIAPDFPGFGLTETSDDYEHTFDNLASTVEQFLKEIKWTKYSMYIFDYGAPIGIRLALKSPSSIEKVISQNGNAYIEGLQNEFWAPIAKFWETDGKDPTLYEAMTKFLQNPESIWSQYYTGVKNGREVIDPLNGSLDLYLTSRPGQLPIQIGLFYDYKCNKDLYPPFQKYLRDSNVPVLAVWSKNDEVFEYPAAEAFKRDVKNLKLKLYDTGHFALETHVEAIANDIVEFLG